MRKKAKLTMWDTIGMQGMAKECIEDGEGMSKKTEEDDVEKEKRMAKL